MQTIYKYAISLTPYTEILMKAHAKILTVQSCERKAEDGRNLPDEIYMWAEVDTDEDDEMRGFIVLGTGEEVDPKYTHDIDYVGTVQLRSDNIVVHIYQFLIRRNVHGKLGYTV